MVIGVLVFFHYRSQQAPALVQLIPQEAEAYAFVDTRNLVKNAFSYGGGKLQDLEVPPLLQALFAAASQAKEPGINLFSEWVWFAFPQGHAALSVRLASPENWEAFIQKEENKAYLEPIERFASDLSLCRLIHANALLAWRGKQLVLVYNDNQSDRVSYAEAKSALQPSAYLKAPVDAFETLQSDVFFQDKDNSLALKLLQGKLRFNWQFHTPKTPLQGPFQSLSFLKEEKDIQHDSSLLLIQPGALPSMPLLKSLLHPFMQSELLQMADNEWITMALSQTRTVPLYFKLLSYPSSGDSADHLLRVSAQQRKLQLPAYLTCKPDSLKGLAWVADLHLPSLSTQSSLSFEGFQRLVMAGTQHDSLGQRWIGTLYLPEKERLPLRETAFLLLQNSVLNLPALDPNAKSSTGTHVD